MGIADEVFRVTGKGINDGLAEYYAKLETEALRDAESRWLSAQVPLESNQDMWNVLLGGGANSDIERSYWNGVVVWLDLPDQNLPTGSAWTINLNDYIDTGDVATFTLNSGLLPVAITLNPDGTFSGTITALAGGSGSVTFTATTSSGAFISGALAWTIT